MSNNYWNITGWYEGRIEMIKYLSVFQCSRAMCVVLVFESMNLNLIQTHSSRLWLYQTWFYRIHHIEPFVCRCWKLPTLPIDLVQKDVDEFSLTGFGGKWIEPRALFGCVILAHELSITYNGIIYIRNPYFIVKIEPCFVHWVEAFILRFFQHHLPAIALLLKIGRFCVPYNC